MDEDKGGQLERKKTHTGRTSIDILHPRIPEIHVLLYNPSTMPDLELHSDVSLVEDILTCSSTERTSRMPLPHRRSPSNALPPWGRIRRALCEDRKQRVGEIVHRVVTM